MRNTNALILVAVGIALASTLAARGGGASPPACEGRIPIDSVPVTIGQPGSYYLTGNLTGASAAHGIHVTADDVTIDLGGFSLVGVPGSWNGIFIEGDSATIEDGVVRGFGHEGVHTLGLDTVVRRLRSVENGGSGLRASESIQVRHSIFVANDEKGIEVRNDALLISIVAGANGTDGIHVTGTNGRIERSTACLNGNTGIGAALASDYAIVENACGSNAGHGIAVGSENRLDDNNCSRNGTAVPGVGILVYGDVNYVRGNLCAENAVGFRMPAVLTGNALLRNAAMANTTANYEQTSFCDTGPIGTAAASVSPWANISN